jgi:hypothetical protein
MKNFQISVSFVKELYFFMVNFLNAKKVFLVSESSEQIQSISLPVIPAQAGISVFEP